MKKFIATLAIAAGLATFGSGVSHADSTQGTDACLDGQTTTIIVGMKCGPGTPTVSQVCATGQAHLTIGDSDYCTPPAVVIVGEYQLGTTYVPRLFAPTRLDVKMGKGASQARSVRCARLGGSYVVRTGVCRGVVWTHV